MRCDQCGSKAEESFVFCAVCGEKLNFSEQDKDAATLNSGKNNLENQEKVRVQPAGKKSVRFHMAAIVVATLLIAFVFAANKHMFGLDLAVFAGQKENSDERDELATKDLLREDFRQQGAEYAIKYTDAGLQQEALQIGTVAWEERVKAVQQELESYGSGAQSGIEETWAEAVRKVCIYALANHYESVMVAESGGRSDEEANERLAGRIEKVPNLLQSLQDAETLEDLQSVIESCDGG